jgi:protein-disulfide isomerase
MDFPIESIHKKALKAHVAANCAGEQDKYWEAHGRLFKTKAMAPNDLTKLAETLGLNMQEFETCINSEKYTDEIRKDQDQGRKAGVRGTPAFYFGLTAPNSSTIKVTEYLKGAKPYASFVNVIEKLLQANNKEN